MAGFIKFYDYVTLNPILEDGVKKEDFYPSLNAQAPQSLIVRIAATHSGKITRNNAFYLPHKMRNSVDSWLTGYPKPILLHHDDHSNPLGRVISAKYVDISNGLHDSFKGNEIKDNLMSPVLLDAFVNGQLSQKEIVDFASKYFINDDAVAGDPSYEGLGFIELTARIADMGAVQAILDKRFLTGSVGCTTDQAICSLCKKDWADGGRCDHMPGKEYDGKKAILIAGNFFYHEYSFVNKPADLHSQIIEINSGGIQDFVRYENGEVVNPSSSQSVSLYFSQDSFKEDNIMTFRDAFKKASQEERFSKLENLRELVKSIVDQSKDLTDEQLFAALDEHIEKPVEDVSAQSTSISDNQEINDENPVKLFFGDEYQDIVGDDAWGEQYAEMLYTLMEDADTEEKKEVAKKIITDAKLSTAKRKALPGSSFCGPDRSFPVPDCAHYTAALRLLGRYKGPGDKSAIRSCVERKGARMGCTSSKQDSMVETSEYTQVDYYDNVNDTDLQSMLIGVTAALEDRKLITTSENLTEDLTAKNKELQDQIAELQSQLETSKQTIEDFEPVKQRLTNAIQEIKFLHSDIDHLEDSLANAQEQVRVQKSARVNVLATLKGQEKELVDSYSAKSTEELDKLIDDLYVEVDITKIADTLNSGLTNQHPEGTVQDPTVSQVNDSSQVLTKEALVAIRDQYMNLRFKSQVLADQFIKDLKIKGILPSQLPEDLLK